MLEILLKAERILEQEYSDKVLFVIVEDVRNKKELQEQFLCRVKNSGEGGIFWPQNTEYTKTSEMVKIIGEVSGHKVRVSKEWNWVVSIASHIPGGIPGLANKAFGNMGYDQRMGQYDFDYQVVDLRTSIKRTESI